MCRPSPHPNPPGRTPTAPRPLQVPRLGRQLFPPYPRPPPPALSCPVRYLYLLRTPASSVPAAGSTCLPDRPQQHPVTLPRAGFSSSHPATRYCSLYSLHCTASSRACCRRPPIPHSLLCTFQSNPIQPAVLSFDRPPIPARTSCRASIVSQTLFSSPCAALGGPNTRSIANRPTVLPLVKPRRRRDW